MRALRFVSVAAVIISIALAASTYGSLPERVPTRLDLSGNPAAISDRSLFGWFLLPGLNLLMFAMFTFIGTRLRAKPHWFNFPEKERFLALPAEHREPVIAEMRLVLEVGLVGVLLMLLAVQVLTWRVALGDEPGLFGLAPLAGVLLGPVILVFVSRVNTATEVAEKRWKAESGTRRA